MSKKLFYRIGEACKLLDIQPYVLRYWETEFPVLSPRKSKAGQRVYSEEELALIRRIKQLLYEEGYTIAGAKKKLESELAGDGAGDAEPAASPPPATARRTTSAAPRSPAPATVASDLDVDEVVADDDEDGAADGEPFDVKATSVAAAVASPASTSNVAAAAASAPPALDSGRGQQVERLRTGLQEALAEARDILRLLSA